MTIAMIAREFESKSEMLEYIRLTTCPHLTVGAKSEGPRKFLAFEFKSQSGEPFWVGLSSSDHGVRPSHVRSGDQKYIALGFDQTLSIIDADAIFVSRSVTLDGAFFEFIPSDSGETLIVMHELGVIKLTFRGARVWSVSTDVLSTWREGTRGSVIVRQYDDGKEIVIDRRTGAVESQN